MTRGLQSPGPSVQTLPSASWGEGCPSMEWAPLFVSLGDQFGADERCWVNTLAAWGPDPDLSCTRFAPL